MISQVGRPCSALCVLLAVCCLLPLSVQAAVPHLVRYQGQAVDAQGVPLQGPYTLTFRLYDADTARNIVWQETQANVPLNKGHFSVLLGQVTALNVDWSQSLWLTVQVGTDPELLPRQRITSVPLAIRSEVAEGLVTQITTSTITDDANKLVPSGAVILWTGGACPAGYTRLTALDGALVKLGAAYAAPAASGASELPAHTHTGPSHTHTHNAHGHDFQWRAEGTFGPGTTYLLMTGTGRTNTAPDVSTVSPNTVMNATTTESAAGTGATGSAGSGQVTTLLACKKD